VVYAMTTQSHHVFGVCCVQNTAHERVSVMQGWHNMPSNRCGQNLKSCTKELFCCHVSTFSCKL